jgi:hypothetical protein
MESLLNITENQRNSLSKIKAASKKEALQRMPLHVG